ncbi:hypothetical protein [Dietzia alimentaria]|uniref:hypothetical protein n=1 Tax=Dietzia alimentaria TaxID=665550 RepID=UPI00029AC2BE|nr:hypothetical protein [Dietzia alimentaria]
MTRKTPSTVWVLGAAALVLMAAAASAELINDKREAPTVTIEQSGVQQQRPTIAEATEAMDAAIADLEPVLFDVIPADQWRQRREPYTIACTGHETQGEYSGPMYTAAGHYLTAESRQQIQTVLAEHGFTTRSELPLDSGHAMADFINDFGDMITISSIGATETGRGGASYGGRTSCHEGFDREAHRS